jgi:hypothetical protein
MMGFIGTSLQLQLIIAAHTLNFFLMPYEEPLWRISHESLINLGLISTTTSSRNALPFITSRELKADHHFPQFLLFFFSVATKHVSNLVATLWLLQAYSLLWEQVPANRCLENFFRFCYYSGF